MPLDTSIFTFSNDWSNPNQDMSTLINTYIKITFPDTTIANDWTSARSTGTSATGTFFLAGGATPAGGGTNYTGGFLIDWPYNFGRVRVYHYRADFVGSISPVYYPATADGAIIFEPIYAYVVGTGANGPLITESIPPTVYIAYDGTYYYYYTSILNDWVQKGTDINGEATGDFSGYSVSLSANGNTVVIGAPNNNGVNGSYSGQVRIYSYSGSTWTQKGSDIDGSNSLDISGSSVSISADGNIIAIGAPNNNNGVSNGGQVRIFEYNGSSWNQLGSDIYGENVDDYSGFSVSLNSTGTVIAIGAKDNDGNGIDSGYVRIYEWNNTNWIKKGSNIYGESAGDLSGYSIQLNGDGNIIAIGATDNTGINGSLSGHVRVYQYNGTQWNQLGNDIDGSNSFDISGYSVSLSSSGYIVAIGAPNNDGNVSNGGQVRIFEYSSSTWNQLGTDIYGENINDFSGISVSLSNDGYTVAIGATGVDINGTDSGYVRVYKWNGSTWIQKGHDILGQSANDNSGRSVSLSSDGNVVAIGAYRSDINGVDSGNVRIFIYSTIAETPTIINAIPNNAYVTIKYSSPITTGFEIVNYTVNVYDPSDQLLTSSTVSATFPLTDIVINSLTNGNAYQFSILANNSVGASTESVKVVRIPFLSINYTSFLQTLSTYKTYILTLFSNQLVEQDFILNNLTQFNNISIPIGSNFYTTTYLTSVVPGTLDVETILKIPKYYTTVETVNINPINGGGTISITLQTKMILTQLTNNVGYYFSIPDGAKLTLIYKLKSIIFIKSNNKIYTFKNNYATEVITNIQSIFLFGRYIFTLKGVGSIIISPSNINNPNNIPCFNATLFKYLKFTSPIVLIKSPRHNKKIYKVDNFELTDDHPIEYNGNLMTWGEYAKIKNGIEIPVRDEGSKYIYNFIGSPYQYSDQNKIILTKKLTIIGGYMQPNIWSELNTKLNIIQNLLTYNINLENHLIYDLNLFLQKDVDYPTYVIYDPLYTNQ